MLVDGFGFSPFSRKMTTRTRAGTRHLIRHKWQRDDLFPRSKSRLFQDFTDDESDNFSENGEYYDDFADFNFVVGDTDESPESDSSSTMSVLQQRFQKLALTEQVNRQQISDNWKEGYWGVWGCSLDPYTEDDAQQKTFVTCIRHMQSSPESDGPEDSALLIVGRSDGSICWLQMETISSSSSSSSSPSTSPSDNDPNNNIENRSITTYFENKLVAKPTDDGGMVVDTALQRRENDSDYNFGETDGANNDGTADESSPRLPFDILAQIQTSAKTSTGSDAGTAIVDMLPLPSARMLWTISQGTPNVIQGWELISHSETDFLLPKTPQQSSKFEIESVHTSPIVAMKVIPQSEDDDNSFVVSVSDNGQVVIWEISTTDDKSPPSVRIRLDANLLHHHQQEDYDGSDSVLSIDVDDEYLYMGSRMGKVSIFSWSEITKEDDENIDTLTLVKSFLAFTSNNPGVSTLLAAGPGTLGATNSGSNNSYNNGNRPQTKSLIAADMSGGLKQWELIPAGKGRLEYWPRLASQKLPGGKPHVYETRDYSLEASDEGQNSFSPAITQLLCIQQVLLAATAHDLTVWDSSTGKILYDMQGLDFVGGGSNGNASYQRPSLIAATESVLVTNGMENFVCVHDFAMDRITSENAQDFFEQENGGGSGDDDDYDSSSFGDDPQSDW